MLAARAYRLSRFWTGHHCGLIVMPYTPYAAPVAACARRAVLALLLLLSCCWPDRGAAAAAPNLLWVPEKGKDCPTTCSQYSVSANYVAAAGAAGSSDSVCGVELDTGATLVPGTKKTPTTWPIRSAQEYCYYYYAAAGGAGVQGNNYMCLCATSSAAYFWANAGLACAPGFTQTSVCRVAIAASQYAFGRHSSSTCQTGVSGYSSASSYAVLCARGGDIVRTCAGRPSVQPANSAPWPASCNGQLTCRATCSSGSGSVSVECVNGRWGEVSGACAGSGTGGDASGDEPNRDPGDCVGSWSKYSSCSARCGGGTQTQTYTVTTAASGGKPCPAADGEVRTRSCNTEGCAQTTCRGSWSRWSNCTARCGGGTQSRTFTVTFNPEGRVCTPRDGEVQSRACNTQLCPVHCKGVWSKLSACSAWCGGGVATQTFTITTPAANNGRPCRFEDGETRTRPCGNDPCPVDCQGRWSAWSACSTTSTCGNGTQSATFKVTTPAANGGNNCVAADGGVRTRACSSQPCPVSCIGGWSNWTACNATCGSGQQSSVYIITMPAAYNGTACEASNSTTRSQSCDTGTPCPPSSAVTVLGVGGSHTCLLKSSGTLQCWGGLNEYQRSSIPGGAGQIKALGVGPSQSCAVKPEGLVCWEGIKAYNSYTIPKTLTGNTSAVAVGGNHVCGLLAGTVQCFGGNGYQQASVPAAVAGIVRSVAAGYSHTCVVTTAGNVACFGRNDVKQASVPAEFASGGKAAAVCAGSDHSCILTVEGTVSCFGSNEFQQITTPAALTGQVVQDLSCGYFHTCVVLKGSGAVICWGDNSFGQSTVPQGLTGAVSVGAGGIHSCALLAGQPLSSSSIRCWGADDFGQSFVPVLM